MMAANELAKGKVGIFPTHCLYGLGTNAFDQPSIERIFAIKKRPFDKPLLVLISHLEQLDDLAVNISPVAHELMRCFWPGRVTFLLNARSGLPKGIVGPNHKIGVRLAGSSIAAALVTQAGVPIIGTSANLSGQPGCYRIECGGRDPTDSLYATRGITESDKIKKSIGKAVTNILTNKPFFTIHRHK